MPASRINRAAISPRITDSVKVFEPTRTGRRRLGGEATRERIKARGVMIRPPHSGSGGSGGNGEPGEAGQASAYFRFKTAR